MNPRKRARERRRTEDEREMRQLIRVMAKNPKLHEMKKYIQHGRVSTYDHCISVAKMSYRLNRLLHAHARKKELIRGAMLHDYFLYDWHQWKGELHGFYHPKAALANAKRDFDLTACEENIIRSHMWPLTFLNFPRSREAVLVCLADKIVSLDETIRHR